MRKEAITFSWVKFVEGMHISETLAVVEEEK